jgi:DNA repair exonuclease SbcCD ATPase subunit
LTIFTKLYLQNFRQYRGIHTIDFTNGFNLIVGLNDLGKSGVLYAILFAVYKHIGTYPSASGLVSFGKSEMLVSLEYISTVTNKKYRVGRSVKNKTLGFTFEEFDSESKAWIETMSSSIKTPESVLINEIARTVGLDKKTFISVVYAQQKTFYNIIHGGAVIKKQLDNILGINASIILQQILRVVINEYQNAIKIENDLQLQYDTNIKEKKNITNQIQSNSTEIDTLDTRISDIQTKQKIWIDLFSISDYIQEKNSVITTKQHEIDSIRNTIKNDYKKDLYSIQQEYGKKEEIENRIEDIKNKQDEINTNTTLLYDAINEKNQLFGELRQDIKTLKSTIMEFNSLEETAECPTCHQQVSKDHIEEKITAFETMLNDKNSLLKTENDTLVEMKKEMTTLNTNFETLESKKEKNNQALYQINSINKNIKNSNDRIQSIFNFNANVVSSIGNKTLELSLIWEELNITDKIPILDKYTVEIFDNFLSNFKPISEKIITKRNIINNELNPLIEHKESLEKSLSTYQDLLASKTSNIEILRKKLDDISNIKKKLQHLMKNEVVIKNLSETIRKVKLEELSKRTFFWYKQLVANVRYRSLLINPENYELRVIPIENDTDDDFPAKSHAGGGNRTVLALAVRIALAELLNFRSILMLDEPTDATDEENTKTLIEGLKKVADTFTQLILITHHGFGENLANNIIRIKRNEEKNTSYIS